MWSWSYGTVHIVFSSSAVRESWLLNLNYVSSVLMSLAQNALAGI